MQVCLSSAALFFSFQTKPLFSHEDSLSDSVFSKVFDSLINTLLFESRASSFVKTVHLRTQHSLNIVTLYHLFPKEIMFDIYIYLQ